MPRLRRVFVLCLTAVGLHSVPSTAAPGGDDVILQALRTESARTIVAVRGREDMPLYYLSYRVYDGTMFNLAASYGALVSGDDPDDPLAGRIRMLDVSARMGSPALDNTHKIQTGRFEFDFDRFGGMNVLPIEDDPSAIRLAVWQATDHALKRAANQLIRVRTNKEVKVAETDDAADFDDEPPQVFVGPPQAQALDRKAWAARLERLSARFKSYPRILHSQVSLEGGAWTSYFVDSQGALIREPRVTLRIMISASATADDGMELNLYRDFEAVSPDQIPDDAALSSAIDDIATRLEALRTAPVIEPYSGPAIMSNRAAAVFFHEIFGHRIEGHRQKDSDEGHTFTHKVGQAVLPSFIGVVDDPTRTKFGDTFLNGHYLYDEEGVPAQSTVLVDHGILKGFLMGRSPIHGFPRSNGHGRAQPGLTPVARQGNLIVSSSRQVPFEELRRELIAEVKRQGKPYGLLFEDISGGFTETRTGAAPQAFKVLPLVVKRVYADGRPDELVRGVDIIGTPLESFEKILATGNDFAVFNGFCGAESGWVPVSAVAPSLLIGDIEVERQEVSHDRPPLLPPPLHADVPWGPAENDGSEAPSAAKGTP